MTKPKASGPPRVALETAFLSSGLPEDVRLPTAAAMAVAVRAHAAEPPFEHALSGGESDHAVAHAIEAADTLGIAGAELTPFLLARVAEITEGRSLRANRALLENNAAVATRIAIAEA